MGEQRFIFNHRTWTGFSVWVCLGKWWITQNWPLPEMSVGTTRRETFSCFTLTKPPPTSHPRLLRKCWACVWQPLGHQCQDSGDFVFCLFVSRTHMVFLVLEQKLFQELNCFHSGLRLWGVARRNMQVLPFQLLRVPSFHLCPCHLLSSHLWWLLFARIENITHWGCGHGLPRAAMCPGPFVAAPTRRNQWMVRCGHSCPNTTCLVPRLWWMGVSPIFGSDPGSSPCKSHVLGQTAFLLYASSGRWR